MSAIESIKTDIATKVVDDLLSAAEAVMVDRRYQILNDEPDEAYLVETMQVHDYLLAVAKEMGEVFGDEPTPIAEETTTVADEIMAYLPKAWTVTDLAKSAKVNKGTLDRILSGETTRPQAKTLRKIEAALGMEEGHLDDDQ